MTIRRDLTELEKVGLIRRTHGGAVNARGRGYEPPLALRSIENKPIKERIGRYAAQLVAEGESISLDIGSTIFEVAAGLDETRNITIVTPSIPIASLFFSRSDVRLILPGGIVRPGETPDPGSSAAEWPSPVFLPLAAAARRGRCQPISAPRRGRCQPISALAWALAGWTIAVVATGFALPHWAAPWTAVRLAAAVAAADPAGIHPLADAAWGEASLPLLARRPVVRLSAGAVDAWLEKHPGGLAVVPARDAARSTLLQKVGGLDIVHGRAVELALVTSPPPAGPSTIAAGAAARALEPRAPPQIKLSLRLHDARRAASHGAVAQLGEHHVRNVGVEGSNPFRSTIFSSPFPTVTCLLLLADTPAPQRREPRPAIDPGAT